MSRIRRKSFGRLIELEEYDFGTPFLKMQRVDKTAWKLAPLDTTIDAAPDIAQSAAQGAGQDVSSTRLYSDFVFGLRDSYTDQYVPYDIVTSFVDAYRDPRETQVDLEGRQRD